MRLAVRNTLYQNVAFIVQLLPARNRKRDFDKISLEVNIKRNDGESPSRERLGQRCNLAAMQQALP